MTFREKLMQEHPEYVRDTYFGGCFSCPYTYDYEEFQPCDGNNYKSCRACWDREMPMIPEELEAHDLAINAEIIRGYCGGRICGKCPARDTCRDEPGTWSDGRAQTSAKKQRAMLDAFEAALPPLDEVKDDTLLKAPSSHEARIKLSFGLDGLELGVLDFSIKLFKGADAHSYEIKVNNGGADNG